MAYYSYLHQMNLWFRMYCLRFPSILPSFYRTYYSNEPNFFSSHHERRSADHIEYLKRFFYQRSVRWQHVDECHYFPLLHPRDQEQLRQWEEDGFPCELTAEHICGYFDNIPEDEHDDYLFHLFKGVQPYLSESLIQDILRHPACSSILKTAIFYHYPDKRSSMILSLDNLNQLSFHYPSGFSVAQEYLSHHKSYEQDSPIPMGFTPSSISTNLQCPIGLRNSILESTDGEFVFIAEPIGIWLLYHINAIEDPELHWQQLILLLPCMIMNYGQYDYSQYMEPYVTTIWHRLSKRHQGYPLTALMDWFVLEDHHSHQYSHVKEELYAQFSLYPDGDMFITLLEEGVSLADILQARPHQEETTLYF